LEKSFLDFKIFKVPENNQTATFISGDNKCSILIGYLDEENDDLISFLTKIIAAVKLNIETDCLKLAIKKDGAIPAFSQIKQQYAVKTAIFFGITPPQLGLKITPPQYLTFDFNDTTFLFVDKLSVISTSEDKKRGLWNCLKLLF
jgi:hypothetical protein